MSIEEKIKNYFTKENLKKEGKELVDTVVFVIVALIIIRFFIFDPRVIPSDSMVPTLIQKDRLIIERFSRFYSSPHRGDIIVFYPPHEEPKKDVLSIFERLTGLFCKDIAYIKRVIGEPNDTVEVKKEVDETYGVYVNGQKLYEPYINSPYEYPLCGHTLAHPYVNANGQEFNWTCNCKITLKEDEYFVMGDNRGNSLDSRYWGPVKKDRIIGINRVRFWPLNRLAYFGKIDYSENE